MQKNFKTSALLCLALIAQTSTSFYFNQLYNFERMANSHFDRSEKLLDEAEKNVDFLAQKTNDMIDTHKRFFSNSYSNNMFDEILGSFGFSNSFRNSTKKHSQEKKGQTKQNSSHFQLDERRQARPIIEVDDIRDADALEFIMDGPEYDIEDVEWEVQSSRPRETISKLKENMGKWSITSQSGLKTSTMTKSYRKYGPGSSGSSTRRSANKRNFVMGMGKDEEEKKIDLNELLDHMEQGQENLGGLIPKDMAMLVKDRRGNVIQNLRKQIPRKPKKKTVKRRRKVQVKKELPKEPKKIKQDERIVYVVLEDEPNHFFHK